uniref:Uncharacterized protein n=1 Tax=Moniliophthora roreri TaxID=221103 RepID=A0A0W0FYJ4_MONRR
MRKLSYPLLHPQKQSMPFSNLTLQDQKLVTPSNCIPGPDPYHHGQPLVTTTESSSSQTQTTPAARMITPLSNETLIETPLFTPLPSPSPPNKTRKALMLSHIAVPSFSRSLRSAHLPNPPGSLKRPRTSQAPKISTTHSREHSLAGTMDRAWARNSTNMTLSEADEHEDEAFGK